MKKLRFFFDFDKEESWLQKMAAKGWQLKSVLFTYTFRKSDPAVLPIRMDFHIFYSKSRYQNYLTLFEDCGWKHIAGHKSVGMHYFVRIRPDASDDLFPDAASKAGRYKRVSEMWLSLFACYIAISSSLFTMAVPTLLFNSIIHPKTAFVIVFFWILPLLFPVLLVICAFAFLYQYRKCIKAFKNLSRSER